MKERLIVLDTETTGFKFSEGEKLVEIGAVEILGNIITDNHYHQYINPSPRQVNVDAEKVHGLSNAFLEDFPKFKFIYQDFLNFIKDSPLIIHNAPFDLGFLNGELGLLGISKLSNKIIDTLPLARNKFKGSPASLDALCSRFGIDNRHRTNHGALLDANLLAEVYIKLTEKDKLDFSVPEIKNNISFDKKSNFLLKDERKFHLSRELITPDDIETIEHNKLISSLNNSLWN